MIKLAGNNGRVEFTHLSQSSCSSLDARLSSLNESIALYQVHTQSVLELLGRKNIPITRVCLLDPKAKTVLAPEDCKMFDCFLFGVRSVSTEASGLLIMLHFVARVY